MSKPRYDWWSYMKAISRKYYARRSKELHGTAQKEQDAVQTAIDETGDLPDGYERVKVVDLVLLLGTHTLPGAAQVAHCSESAAKQYYRDFIMLVAKNYGLKGGED